MSHSADCPLRTTTGDDGLPGDDLDRKGRPSRRRQALAGGGCRVLGSCAATAGVCVSGRWFVTSAFDRALELDDLFEGPALMPCAMGAPGTAANVAAWARFRERIRTGEDLARFRTAVAAKRDRTAAAQARRSPAGRASHAGV
jgi:hypothetical protein